MISEQKNAAFDQGWGSGTSLAPNTQHIEDVRFPALWVGWHSSHPKAGSTRSRATDVRTPISGTWDRKGSARAGGAGSPRARRAWRTRHCLPAQRSATRSSCPRPGGLCYSPYTHQSGPTNIRVLRPFQLCSGAWLTRGLSLREASGPGSPHQSNELCGHGHRGRLPPGLFPKAGMGILWSAGMHPSSGNTGHSLAQTPQLPPPGSQTRFVWPGHFWGGGRGAVLLG